MDLRPDVAPDLDRRFDDRDLHRRRVIHHGSRKAAHISGTTGWLVALLSRRHPEDGSPGPSPPDRPGLFIAADMAKPDMHVCGRGKDWYPKLSYSE